MKNNKLLSGIYKNFFVQIFTWTFALVLFFVLLFYFLNRSDFQWVYDFSPSIYYFFVRRYHSFINSFYIFVFGIWLIGIFVLGYRLLKRISSYILAMEKASSDLVNEKVEYITLPSELEDISKRMNLFKREYEKKERIAREQVAKKNDLIVYLAHDLKTPLTSIIGYLSLLDEVKDMPVTQREKYIDVVLDKSYRLEDLINELFDIARFNAETIVLEKEKVNLNMMLEQIVEDFYPMLQEQGKEIELKMKDKIYIYVDSDKMARVFGNLIKNAIYYSTDKMIEMEVFEEKESVFITVANKGKKIPKEKLEKIFEKFYRVDSSRTTKTGGSGLGLAIARELVELHDGNIRVTSDEEVTKFYIELPILKS